jgi:opacity protein-like surface antigen
MKKLSILTVLVMVLCFSTSSYGADAAGRTFYIGIGGSYASEAFDLDEVEDDLEAIASDSDLDYDDTWGLNLKVGYHVNNWLSLEFDFDYLSEFEADEGLDVLGVPVDLDVESDVITYMAMFKFTCVLEPLKPFIVAGGGIMDADVDAKASALGVSASASESETDTCAKLGLGVDFFVTKSVSIGLEGSYVRGFGDVDAIGYYNLTLGLGYHF